MTHKKLAEESHDSTSVGSRFPYLTTAKSEQDGLIQRFPCCERDVGILLGLGLITRR